jgi:hypothetical protein
MAETELETLTRERNFYKGKNASLLALISKMRDRIAVITTEIEDEGDRAYFGSTNDADELKEFESDMIAWLIDAEVPHLTMTEDPYASIREQRERADKAEAENERLRKASTDVLDYLNMDEFLKEAHPDSVFGIRARDLRKLQAALQTEVK